MLRPHPGFERLVQATVRAVVHLALGKMAELPERTEVIVRQTLVSLEGCDQVPGRLGYDRPPSPVELDHVPWYLA